MRLRLMNRDRRAIGTCAIILGLAAILAGTASAEDFTRETIERATFVLTSGEAIEMVPFEVDERFRTVSLETADGKRNVSFGDIASVSVGDEDISELILGRPAIAPEVAAPKVEAPDAPSEPAAVADAEVMGEAEAIGDDAGEAGDVPAVEAPAETSQESWVSKDSPTYRKASAPLWQVGLRVAGNYSLPVGDYYDGIDAGIGYEGDIIIGVKRQWAMRLSISRSGMTPDDGMDLYPLDPAYHFDDIDLGMNAWRFTIAAQVHQPLSKREGDLSLAYVYTGLGAISQEMTFEADLIETGSAIRTPVSDSYSETKFMTTFGGGILKMVSPTVGVDFAAEMDIVYIGTVDDDTYTYSYYGNTQTALLIDFKLGIVKLFK